MKIKALLQNKNIKNAGWLIGEQIFQMLLSMVIGIMTARYLGTGNYGALNYTASFVSFALSFATLGMEGVLIRRMIAEPDEEGLYLGSCLGYRVVSSLISMCAITLLVFWLNPDEKIKVVLVFLQSIQLFFRAFHIFDSWFQRHLKSKYVAIGKMIASIIVACYKVFLLVSDRSIVWFAISNTLSDLIIAMMLYIFYKCEKAQGLRYEFKVGKSVLIESYHFILSGMMTAIYSQIGKIIIGELLTDSDVAFFSVATGISGMWIFVPTSIINSFRPMIMEHKKRGEELLYKKRLSQLYSFVIWLCIVVSIIVCLLAKPAIYILYGEEYLGAVMPLCVVIWSEIFAMIGTARGIWILCEKKNKYVKYYLAIGAVISIIANCILIKLWGVMGAAFATLITQITTSLIAPLLFKETRMHTFIVLDAFAFGWHRKKNNNEEQR